MAAKTWGADFRAAAIYASVHALGAAHREDPYQFGGSFCLPVGPKPIVGWTPGRFVLIGLAVGVALLVAGLALGKVSERVPNAQPILAVAECCAAAGILALFLPLMLYEFMVQWLLGDRANALLQRAPSAQTMVAELTDAETSAKISIDGCDHVLLLFDEDNRRVMMEGIGARYQICAANVETITPFEFMNHIGAQIAYRIDPQTCLRIVVARASVLAELRRRLPLLGFLRAFRSNKLLENSLRTLQPGRPLDSLR
jgi:hypothetical protein